MSSNSEVRLSKSWKVCGLHVRSYDGGKVSLSPREEEEPFLCAMNHGDVSLIDLERGTLIKTLRTGAPDKMMEQQELADDDDDDEGEDNNNDSTLSDPDAIVCFALAPNSSEVVCASRNGILRQYHDLFDDSNSGPVKVKRTIGRAHDMPVRCMEYHSHPSSVFLATGGVDGRIKVWDMRGGFATHSFMMPSGVSALSWLPHQQHNYQGKLLLAAGSDDGTIQIFDLKNERDKVILKDHVSVVTAMRWSEEGDLFFSAGRDSVINIWSIDQVTNTLPNIPSGKKKRKNPDDSKPKIQTINKYTRIKTIPIYENVEGFQLLSSQSSVGEIVLASAGSKGQIRIWKVSRGDTDLNEPTVKDVECILSQPKEEAFGEEKGGYLHLLLNDKKNELISINAEHNIEFLNDSTLNSKRIIVGHNDEVIDLKVISTVDSGNHDPKIAVATNSSQVRLFSLTDFSCTLLSGHTDTVLSVDVSPCGRLLSTVGKDKVLRVWHTKTSKCVAVGEGHTEAVGANAMSQKAGKYDVAGQASASGAGAFIVTCSKDKTLKRWALPCVSDLEQNVQVGNVSTLHALGTTRAHEKDINVVSISPNDSLIASGSQDKTVKIWNSVDLSLKGVLNGHRRGVWDCQFSAFDRILATGSGDQTVKLWSIADFSCVRTFQGHTSSVLRVRFLCSGMQLVSSGADGLIKLWTIRNFECESTMDFHYDKVWALDVAPDESVMVSGGADSRITVWRDNTKEVQDAKHQAEEENIKMEQELSNHVRNKRYEEALNLTMELKKPRQCLKILNEIIQNHPGINDSLSTLSDLISKWESDKITQILEYCREWNTRARNARVAMTVIRSITGAITANKLSKTEGIKEILEGLIPYSERHFERLDKLTTSSYLLDFMLSTMGDLEIVAPVKPKYVLPTKVEQTSTLSKLLNKRKYVSDENDDDVSIATIGESDSSVSSSDDDDDHGEDR